MLAVDLSDLSRADSIILNMDTCRLLNGKCVVRIRPTVMRVLARLAQEPGKVVPRDEIINAAGGHASSPDINTRARDILRRSRAPLVAMGLEDPIETVYNVGWRLMYPINVIANLPAIIQPSQVGAVLAAIETNRALRPLRPQRLECVA